MTTLPSKLNMRERMLAGMFLAGLACIIGPESLVAQNSSGSGDQWQVSARAARKPNPIERSDESIEIGRQLFESACVVCHGTSGRGDGPGAAALVRPPGNLTDPRIWEQTDGSLYWKIRTGKAPMPIFGTSLSKDQIWHLVNYIRTLAKAPKGIGLASISAPGTPPEFSMPDHYVVAMSEVLGAYLSLQEALHADRLPAAEDSASALEHAVSKLPALDREGVPRIVLGKWLSTTRPLKTKTKAITASKDLPAMRQAFRTLSVHIIRAVRRFGHAEVEAVQLYSCPHALGKVGVTWLQRGQPARNPYLGQESSCGELLEALGGGMARTIPDNDQGGSR